MSSTKSRGRPIATQIIEASTSPLISNIATTINAQTSVLQQHYVPSLLKIESVVPTRLNANRSHQQRANRLITRSYSTLCGPVTSTIAASAAVVVNPLLLTNGTVNYKNVTKKINTNLHRHKNHHQRLENGHGHESPTGKINNQQTNDTSCVIVENGVHKIRRTPKEKDKQPDRINLDRRGLCTIPVIDNEPNLRLLSLQHNLINTFHIPDSELTVDVASVDGVKDNNNNVPSKDMDKSNSNQAPSAAINNKSTKPFLKQKSISRNQLNLNFSANNNAMMVANGMVGSGVAGKANGAITPTSFLQKSFMFQSKAGLLKRANSVMINYTPSLTPTAAIAATATTSAVHNQLFGAQRNKLVATPSFSVIDIHTHHEMANVSVISKATPDIQIDANNSYMNSFRFNLTNLVFLDLYNNQIEKISCLDGLKSLTVLLLGKNRISDITGITSLKQTLRVLDLHGNRITHISQKICQLQELKSLNLAGNMLRHIQSTDFAGLCCLKELNLKRNRIKKINVSDDLHNLERLWLCHNELQNIEDMSSIAKSINLKEITIENNPISLAGDCVSFLVSYLPLLNSLNQLQITEQVRRAANAWRRSKENTDQSFQHLSTDVSSSIRREEIISNARTNWELIRQANIINGSQRQSNQLKKPIKTTPKLTPNNSSSSTSTASSSNVNTDSGKAKNSSRQMIDVAKRQKPKLFKSSSAENSSPMASEKETDGECEFFHLPPVLGQYVDPPNKNPSTASSTRPNVDSESSAFSSDTDDQKSFRSRVPTTPPIHQIPLSQPPSPIEIVIRENDIEDAIDNESFTPPLPPIHFEPVAPDIVVIENNRETMKKKDDPVDELIVPLNNPKEKEQKATLTIVDNFNAISLQPTINIETDSIRSSSSQQLDVKSELIETDKLSIISSKASAKTSTDSINTLSSANDERQVHSSHTNYHQRNRSGARKLAPPPLVRSQTARNLSTAHLNNHTNGATNQGGGQKKEPKKETDKDREQGGDYLVEILGRYLNVYGVGAIKFVDKLWNTQKAQDVHTVKFSYINFNSISPILGRIKIRFPNVEHYVFRETNFVCLGQLNAMADTQGLKSITIDPEGNPLANKNWRTYAIYRLNHWGLKQINGVEISDEEITDAENTYGGLSDLVLWSLPDSLLQPLFTRLHVDEVLLNSKLTPKEWLMKQADESIRHVVGKEALQWKKNTTTPDELVVRRRGKVYFSGMMENTVNAVDKLQKLDYLWPNILLEMIRNTLIDYSQIDLYVRNLMSEVMKDNN